MSLKADVQKGIHFVSFNRSRCGHYLLAVRDDCAGAELAVLKIKSTVRKNRTVEKEFYGFGKCITCVIPFGGNPIFREK